MPTGGAGRRWPGHTVLQVPVEPLDAFVVGRYRHHDPSLLGWGLPGEPFVHAHVTVLGPFATLPDDGLVADLAAATAPVEARCTAVDTFPNGIIHVPVEPAEDFAAMTRRASATFGTTPYGGRFPVAPHVTLEADRDGIDQAWVERRLSGVLPVRFTADRLDVVWYEQDATHLVARHDLGTGTPPRGHC